MSLYSYDAILKLAREELSDGERHRLVAALKKSEAQENGAANSVYESMANRGLIGKLTTAPADLSTNPAYMEGFGKDAK